MDLRLPVDIERLPEFRNLSVTLLRPDAEVMFIWVRLWIELSYQAQVTNKPGLLDGNGGELFSKSLGGLNITGDIFQTLFKCGILKPEGDKGWFCERFAKLNGHLSGNFVSREQKGAAATAYEKNRARIAHEANQQTMLLAPEVFRVPVSGYLVQKDDEPAHPAMRSLTAPEINRCMVLIKTLDNCLKLSRKRGEYTEGLIADAWAVAEKHGQEALREFYIWLATNREHPAVPKTTEQVLAKFEEVFAMKG
jgi:hypothetical protein